MRIPGQRWPERKLDKLRSRRESFAFTESQFWRLNVLGYHKVPLQNVFYTEFNQRLMTLNSRNWFNKYNFKQIHNVNAFLKTIKSWSTVKVRQYISRSRKRISRSIIALAGDDQKGNWINLDQEEKALPPRNLSFEDVIVLGYHEVPLQYVFYINQRLITSYFRNWFNKFTFKQIHDDSAF